jgi:tetratricopeptide (TPR) repeat protein
MLQIAQRRFPDEPRFKLAEVYCDERRTTIIGRANVMAIQTQTPEDGVIAPRLLEKRPDPQAVTIARAGVDAGMIPTALALIDGVGAGYEALTAEPALRAEALVRLGYHRIRVGDRVGAIGAFGQALDDVQDVDLRYLSYFFRGWTLHRLDRREEAERDYEAALRLRPDSRQVRALLAAVIADRGDRREAREVLGEFLSRALPAADPWFVFHQGEYRYWPVRVVAMREALR